MQGVELIDPDGRYGTLSADAYVVAMGSFSPAMLRPLGIPCNVYPAKGYSSTFPIVRPDAAPVVSLTDSSHKIVSRGWATGCAWPARQSCRLFPWPEHRALRGAYPPRPRTFPTRSISSASVGPAPVHAFQRAHHRPQSYPQFVCQHGTRYARLDDGVGRALADVVSGRQPEPEFPFLGL